MEDENNQYINWESIFNSIGDAIFIADIDNNIIKANVALSKLLNTKLENIIGKKCYELVHKTKKPWPECPFEKSKKDGRVHTEEIDDPSIEKSLMITTSPIFDAQGLVIGVVHVSRDITERKKAEEDLRQKLSELERFKKITIGRELKMKELKARIVELELRLVKEE